MPLRPVTTRTCQTQGLRSRIVAMGERRQAVGQRRTKVPIRKVSATSGRDASDWSPEANAQFGYLTCTPEMARAMISRWISDVPSKMVKIFESRCHRSTGYSRT